MKKTTNTTTKKRFLSGLITVAMTVSVLATSLMSTVTAAESQNNIISLNTENTEVYAGTDVVITADIEKNTGLAGFLSVISYDGSLKTVNYKNGDCFDMTNCQFNNAEGVFSIVSAAAAPSVDGTITKLTFHIPDDAQAGTVYNFEWQKADVYDQSAQIYDYTTSGLSLTVIEEPITISSDKMNLGVIGQKSQLSVSTKRQVAWISTNEEVATVDDNGYVTAVGIGATKVYAVVGSQKLVCNVIVDVRGHINGSEKITSTDVTRILSQLAHKSAGSTNYKPCNDTAADINLDGTVDSKDASLVLKYCAMSMLYNDLTWDVVFVQMNVKA